MTCEKMKHRGYPEETRKAIVISAKEKGLTKAQATREYGVSFTAITNWCEKYNITLISETANFTYEQKKDIVDFYLDKTKTLSQQDYLQMLGYSPRSSLQSILKIKYRIEEIAERGRLINKEAIRKTIQKTINEITIELTQKEKLALYIYVKKEIVLKR